jgi:hypothetical protein
MLRAWNEPWAEVRYDLVDLIERGNAERGRRLTGWAGDPGGGEGSTTTMPI